MQFYGDDWQGVFEAITGYGLGGSSIALFGRVGGGIYTKVRAGMKIVLYVVQRLAHTAPLLLGFRHTAFLLLGFRWAHCFAPGVWKPLVLS